MKYSYQREEILKVVKASSGHISALEVYDEVKKTIPNISLGTVYRNLNSLVEHNYITKVNMPSGSEFDSTTSIFCLFFIYVLQAPFFINSTVPLYKSNIDVSIVA